MIVSAAPKTLSVIHELAQALRQVCPRTADWETKAMLRAITQKDLLQFFTGDASLTPLEKKTLKSWVQRRLQGEPLAYITGNTSFMDMTLAVGPGVLIPRIETEVLVKKVLEFLSETAAFQKKSLRALDLGTGSGNIAVGLTNHHSRIWVDAVEASSQARRIAQVNVNRYGKGRVSLVEMDFVKDRWDMARYLSRVPRLREWTTSC